MKQKEIHVALIEATKRADNAERKTDIIFKETQGLERQFKHLDIWAKTPPPIINTLRPKMQP